jgi:hypothetical protein
MSVQTEELSVDLLEQVLSRLGLAERPAPTLDGLQTLYAAWCRKVPFDNVRKLIHFHSQAPGPLPGDAPRRVPYSLAHLRDRGHLLGRQWRPACRARGAGL